MSVLVKRLCRPRFTTTTKNVFWKHYVAKPMFVRLSSETVQSKPTARRNLNAFITVSDAFSQHDCEALLREMLVREDFISSEEENSLLTELEPYMQNLRYEFDHWDDAIHGFRETERLHWTKANSAILDRVRQAAFPLGKPQLKHVHVLDLSEKGYIKPHIDSIKFCGDTIAGLSLISSCVMRLVHEKEKEKVADVLLKPRSLYIMKNSARYDYTHEVLGMESSKFKGERVPRGRRISVICRSEISRQQPV